MAGRIMDARQRHTGLVSSAIRGAGAWSNHAFSQDVPAIPRFAHHKHAMYELHVMLGILPPVATAAACSIRSPGLHVPGACMLTPTATALAFQLPFPGGMCAPSTACVPNPQAIVALTSTATCRRTWDGLEAVSSWLYLRSSRYCQPCCS